MSTTRRGKTKRDITASANNPDNMPIKLLVPFNADYAWEIHAA